MEVITEEQVLKAVEEYAYSRFDTLSPLNIDRDFNDEDLARMATDRNGYLEITIDDLVIEESQVLEDITIWYVSATLYFDVNDGGERIEGTTDVYECYRSDNGKWNVDWHHS